VVLLIFHPAEASNEISAVFACVSGSPIVLIIEKFPDEFSQAGVEICF
jgi:hypothetical protein